MNPHDLWTLVRQRDKAATWLERACRTKERVQVDTMLHQVVAEIASLKRAAQPMLDGSSVAHHESKGSGGSVDVASLKKPSSQLAEFDLGAVQSYRTLAPQLRSKMGTDSFDVLARHMDDLQFGEAAAVLHSEAALSA